MSFHTAHPSAWHLFFWVDFIVCCIKSSASWSNKFKRVSAKKDFTGIFFFWVWYFVAHQVQAEAQGLACNKRNLYLPYGFWHVSLICNFLHKVNWSYVWRGYWMGLCCWSSSPCTQQALQALPPAWNSHEALSLSLYNTQFLQRQWRSGIRFDRSALDCRYLEVVSHQLSN